MPESLPAVFSVTRHEDDRPNQLSLLLDSSPVEARQELGHDSWVLRGSALPHIRELLLAVAAVEGDAAPRRMVTPGGGQMSALMSSCGAAGWTSDASGYSYRRFDPATGRRWPEIPRQLSEFARDCAREAGFEDYRPNSCLINRYPVGARMGLHQDRNEGDTVHPIVSVSLGLPATFLFGGLDRHDATNALRLVHGDVVVFGGRDRLCFHGIRPVADGFHELLGASRVNLTFRVVHPAALR